MLLKKKLFTSYISILLVIMLSISVLPITVSASELKVVDIDIEPITIVEYTGGYYTKESNTEYYFYEPEYIMQYSVTFNDGTVIEDYSYYFEYNDEHFYFDTVTNQSYKNQWKSGNTYSMNVTIDNITIEVPVTIKENPIANIEIQPISILEGNNGYYTTEYGDNTETPIGKYFYYEPEYLLEYTVTLTDGTVIEDSGYYFEYEDTYYYFDVFTEQSYYNQWTVGNTYEMKISLGKLNITVPVTITSTPVKSIEVKNIDLIEFQDGYYETDEFNSEYFRYCPEYNLEYKVTLKDGKIYNGTGNGLYIDNKYYSFDIYTNQSYDNQWKTGQTYSAKATLAGVSTEVAVTIIQTPITDIVVEPITLCKDIDSELTTDYNPETDKFDLEYDWYYFDNSVSFTILWKDGTSSKHTLYDDITYNNRHFYANAYSDQSYYASWEVGNTYNANISIIGKTVAFPVNVAPSPVKSIEFIKVPYKTEYVTGEVIDLNGAVIRVNYNDKAYEDIEITSRTNSYLRLYLNRFNKSLGMTIYPFTADSKFKSINIHFLGKDATTNISVANKTITDISLSGSGINLSMEITYSDSTKQTSNVLYLEPTYDEENNNEFIRKGSLVTNKGIFNAQIIENTNSGNFYAILDTESTTIKSNTVYSSQCKWWESQKKIYSLASSISTYTKNSKSYYGNVTSENIDELLSIVCSTTNMHYYNENYADNTNTEYIFYADKVKTAFNEVFGVTPDLTLSNKYNAKKNTVSVSLFGFGGMSYSQPQIEQSNNSIRLTIECNPIINSPYPMIITFNNDLKVISFDYSETILAGDVNNDGVVNIVDATEIQKYLAGLVTFDDTQMKSADYNGDGFVSIIDATNIQKTIAGLT